MISANDLDEILKVLAKNGANAFHYKNGEEELEVSIPGKLETPDTRENRKAPMGFNSYPANLVTFDDSDDEE